MEILFLSSKSPLPLNDGHSKRTFHLLKQLATQHSITLVTFVKYEEEFQLKKELEAYCRSVTLLEVPENKSKMRLWLSLLLNICDVLPFVVRKYQQPAMRLFLSNLIKKQQFDLVHLDSLPLGIYQDLFDNIPIVLNQHNVESALLARRIGIENNWLARCFYQIQQKRLAAYEKRLVLTCNHTIVCSDDDKRLLSMMAPEKPITIVPNGVDLDYYSVNDST